MNELIKNEVNKYAKTFYEMLLAEDYKIIGKNRYKNAVTNIWVECNKGHAYSVRPSNFKSGRRCPHCFNPNHNRDTSKFKREIEELVGNEYDLLGEYAGAHIKIEFVHILCGNRYFTTPTTFLSGSRCPKCMRPGYYRDTRQFKSEIFELVGEEYSLISEYELCTKKLLMRHNKCGNEYAVTPNKFLMGRRCPKCKRSYQPTTEEFNERVKSITDGEYVLTSEYINRNTKVKIRHTLCKNEFLVVPDKFIHASSRCPHCRQSRGERLVENILINNEVDYKIQVRFNKCRYKKPLPFDFGVYENGELVLLIEYQGEQHYKPFEFFGGQEWLNLQKKRDSIKRDFCKNNSIPLIEINYSLTDDEVSEFLLSELSKSDLRKNKEIKGADNI